MNEGYQLISDKSISFEGLSSDTTDGDHLWTMQIQQIRHANLVKLLNERFDGVIAQLAKASGKDRNYVRFLIYPEKPGGRAMGEKLAREIETALGLPSGWLDVHPEDHEQAGHAVAKVVNLGAPVQTPPRPVRVIDNIDEADPEHGIFEVPRYTLRASAGEGEPVLEIDEAGTPNFCRSAWAKREGLQKEKLFSIVAKGDSMVPTIPDGASIIVHKQKRVVSGRIHVICRNGECFVKRLYAQLDGSLLIRSDNAAAYKDVTLQPDELEDVHVVGLVVSVSFNV
ncbi:S24 family peptidase [Chitinolyticbacter meiyuanensis]|uniref:S24 family peptidase n=1 Tax=Chitinolyticbacter meiyuanensis TaxID=682798 RepID=UPI0011E5BA8A|nr:S24 family peptidase [Chitinolyticbacter meiyuanensis]